MGIDRDYNVAFAKSQLGGGARLPKSGTVFVSVKDADKPRILEATRLLAGLGFRVMATSGTQRYLAEHGVAAVKINKVAEGRPHIVDAIKNGEVQVVFNTTEGATALATSRFVRCKLISGPNLIARRSGHSDGTCRDISTSRDRAMLWSAMGFFDSALGGLD